MLEKRNHKYDMWRNGKNNVKIDIKKRKSRE